MRTTSNHRHTDSKSMQSMHCWSKPVVYDAMPASSFIYDAIIIMMTDLGPEDPYTPSSGVSGNEF